MYLLFSNCLYGVERNAFDAGNIHYEGHGKGWALKSRLFLALKRWRCSYNYINTVHVVAVTVWWVCPREGIFCIVLESKFIWKVSAHNNLSLSKVGLAVKNLYETVAWHIILFNAATRSCRKNSLKYELCCFYNICELCWGFLPLIKEKRLFTTGRTLKFFFLYK